MESSEVRNRRCLAENAVGGLRWLTEDTDANGVGNVVPTLKGVAETRVLEGERLAGGQAAIRALWPS